MILYKDIMAYFDKFYLYMFIVQIWVVPIKNLDAQKFYNFQFWAPNFQILAKTLPITQCSQHSVIDYLWFWDCNLQ